MADVREYTVSARSTEVFGRVRASARTHEIVIDGPVENGCPGEELTPAELFLGGVATCAAELIQVIAHAREVPLRGVRARIHGVIDRGAQPRTDVSLFTSVRLDIEMNGVSDDDAEMLVEAFKGR